MLREIPEDQGMIPASRLRPLTHAFLHSEWYEAELRTALADAALRTIGQGSLPKLWN